MKHSKYTGKATDLKFESLFEQLSSGLEPCNRQGHLAQALDAVLRVQDPADVRPSAIDVAMILKHLGVDETTLVATLLSDPRLRDRMTEAQITRDYGEITARLVRSINWLNTFKECSEDTMSAPDQAEILRRMLLATVEDVRAVLVKLAYRVQRLRQLPEEEPEIRQCIARETRDLYSPLANRLGVGELKWEMEDLVFRHLEPETYKDLARSMEDNRAQREAFIHQFVEELSEKISREGITPEIYGRPKHLYSIWRKMKRKQVQVNELADLLAVRVIVDTPSQCYLVLGIVHSHWKHLPHEFDDYIANTKENGYQSLHTAVVGPEGRVVEVQIRTREMDDFAEHGVAAHWRYKEGSKQDQAMEHTIATLRSLLDQKEDDELLLEDFSAELFQDRVFVLTPKGEVVDLQAGATPLDFAYSIHTDVGHRTRGAKVDGHIVPLNYQLKSGERVEILTTKESRPSRDWMDVRLGYLKSARARAKIRRWYKHQDYDIHVREGRVVLDRVLKHMGSPHADLEALAKRFNLKHADDLLAALGSADVTPGHLASALSIPSVPEKEHIQISGRSERVRGEKLDKGITIQGVGNLMTSLAECCHPVPGDPVIGYITQGRGVTIHRKDCPNILSLGDDRHARLVEVSWGDQRMHGKVTIHVEAFDRQGLLMDVTQVLSNADVNVLSANTQTDTEDQSVHMDITIEVEDAAQLSNVLERISDLPNIFEVSRTI
jgi:GTP pyrophosphokinase